MSSYWTRTHSISTALATTTVILWGIGRNPLLAYDDAFITYRYAQNLAQGTGYIYNVGESVLGITTPLWGALLGGVAVFVPDIALIGHWLSIGAWIALLIAATALLLQLSLPRAAMVAPLLLATSAPLLHSVGMETLLLVALMLGCAWAWLASRRSIVIVLGALLVLTRHDAALWLFVIGLMMWQRTRIFPWREGVMVSILTLPWFAFASWFYGSPLPNSAAAKIGQTNLMPAFGSAPFPHALWNTFIQGYSTPLVILVGVCMLVGIVTILVERRDLWWLLTWLAAYLMLYLGFGVVVFPWYLIPPVVMLLLLVALGIGRISNLLPPAIAVAITLILTLQGVVTTDQMRASAGTTPDYFTLGEWLKKNTAADATVATIEIGVIGYLSNRPILDTMGLISPAMTDHQVGWSETLVYALDTQEPDYVVAVANTAWDGIIERWWFQTHYQPVYQVGRVTLYQKQPLIRAYASREPRVALDDGIDIVMIEAAGQTITPTQPLDIWINVEAVAQPQHDHQLTLFLIDPIRYTRYAITTITPFDGAYRTSRWQQGDKLQLPVRLDLPADLPQGTYQLGLTLFDMDTGQQLAMRQDNWADYSELRFGWFRTAEIGDVSADLNDLQYNLVRWQNQIELSGIGMSRIDDQVIVAMRWQTLAAIDRNLKLFLHMIDQQDNIVAQSDVYPLGGRLLTPVWRTGEYYSDRVAIALPPDLPAGEYRFRLGFYDEDGQLPLQDAATTFTILPETVVIESSSED